MGPVLIDETPSYIRMPSRTESKAWDFSQALDLINTLSSPSPSIENRELQDTPKHRDSNASNLKSNGLSTKVGLGDFSRVWEFLGQPDDLPPPDVPALTFITPPDKPSYISDGATYQPAAAKGVKWRDEAEEGASLTEGGPEAAAGDSRPSTKTQRKKARRRAKAELAARQRTASDFESEADIPRAPARKASVHNIAAHLDQSSRFVVEPKEISGNLFTPQKTPQKSSKKRNAQPFSIGALAAREILQSTAKQDDCPIVTPHKSHATLEKHHASEPRPINSQTQAPREQQIQLTPSSQPSKAQTGQQLHAALQAGYQHQLPAHVSHTTAPAHNFAKQQPVWLQPGFLHPPAAATAAAVGAKHERTKPLFIREGDDRNLALRLKLIHDFGEDKKWLTSPVPMANHTKTPNGIHVFIDYSNIWIGFMELVKRLTGLHPHERTPHKNMSFDSLVLLLERGRPVAKRTLAGSAPFLPAFETAKAIGYELNILNKVFKAKELTERQRRYAGKEAGGATTSEGSGSETGTLSHPSYAPEKWVEQGVDEILHLKLLETIVDASDDEVSTIVLATGDAAEAEYSAGFMRMVERALKKGWKVELASWSKGMSYLYRKREFLEAWEEKFKVVDLDDFAEYLLDT